MADTTTTLMEYADITTQINQIQSEITGIVNSIEKVQQLYKDTKTTIEQTPKGKIKINLQIEGVRKVESPLLELNYLLDKLNLKKKKVIKSITEEEYQKGLKILSDKNTLDKSILEEKVSLLQKELNSLDKTTRQKQVKEQQDKKKQNAKNNNLLKKNKARLSNLNYAKTLAVKNLTASLKLIPPYLPVILSFLTTQLLQYIDIVSNLSNEIDNLNAYIDTINQNPQPSTTEIAINRKNALLNKLDSAEKKFKLYSDILNILEVLSTVASVALNINSKLKQATFISAEATAKGPPSIVTAIVSINLYLVSKRADDLKIRFENILAVLLPSISIAAIKFTEITGEINELKSKIKDIENRIENRPPLSDNIVINPIPVNGTLDMEYKGFRFAIREDNKANAPSVNGIYRHYGVAIDTSGIEVLRTDSSFTQDTQILTDQLKLIIDTQNLKA
jgi:hypothetical protein